MRLCCELFLANDCLICLARPLEASFGVKVVATTSLPWLAYSVESVVLATPLTGAKPRGPRLIFLPDFRRGWTELSFFTFGKVPLDLEARDGAYPLLAGRS